MVRRTEFALIRTLLAPLAGSPGAAGLTDDAALLEPPDDGPSVVTTDTMVEGVHFPVGGRADLIARRLLRVNLSDLAATNARPHAYLLNLALPARIDDPWLELFASGLREDQEAFGIGLLGGDTVGTTGPLTLTATAFGTSDRPVRRDGAKPGDTVFVTGAVGDGHFGLSAATGRLDAPRLADRFWLPSPRFGTIADANAAADISDGLVADLGHITAASGVGAEIDLAAVPLSPEVEALGPDARLAAVTGGDDYEIVFTAPEGSGGSSFPIGRIVPGAGVAVRDAEGRTLALGRTGWSHD